MPEDVTVHARSAAYPAGDPVSDVWVGLYQGGVFVTSDTTADGLGALPEGDLVFPAVAEGNYELRINPGVAGTVVNGHVQNITVVSGPTNIFDIEVSIAGLPVATDSRLCRCSGHFVDATGKPVPDLEIHLSEHTVPQLLYTSQGSTTMGVIPTVKVAKTDKNGYAVIDLIRGASYSVQMQGFMNKLLLADVPDSDSVLLPDIIFPTLETVEYRDGGILLTPVATPSIALTVGTDKTLTVKVLLRSGVEVEPGLIGFQTDDSDVFTVARSGSELVLHPVAAGTANLVLTPQLACPGNHHYGIDVFPDPLTLPTLAVTVT
jgi:hypothetical protein